jgi:cytoplasmic iron level regulating protein YaaA (DUF328/UPF0246 family)
MLVLLPPSETKSDGGSGPPLDLDALSFPELNPVRERLVSALVALSADVPASLTALGLTPRQSDEVARNGALRSSPTRPSIERYTGVLYDALDIAGFTRAERRRAETRLAVASALFGVLRAADPVPAYRLSGGSSLPGLGTLRSQWHAALSKTLSTLDELILDLRSSPYAQLAPIPHAITVRVVTADRRTPVSHANKSHKGRLAAALARTPREPTTIRAIIRTATTAGLHLDHPTPGTLHLLT